MGIRKQPFGYRVEMGEVVLHAQEAKLVEYIFQQYLSGASFNTLVAQLREQSIPYDEGKLWNKNMVARILEDHRYTGEGGYPAITDQETLSRVLEKRSAKQAPAPAQRPYRHRTDGTAGAEPAQWSDYITGTHHASRAGTSAQNPSASVAKGIGYRDGPTANR